jgi:hypothetical protein
MIFDKQEYFRQYYQNHKAEIQKKNDQLSEEEKQTKKEYFKEYYQKNLKDKARQFYIENKIQILNERKNNYIENRDKKIQYQKKYIKKQKELRFIKLKEKAMKFKASILSQNSIN